VNDKLTPFYAWLDELNAEAVRRGYDPQYRAALDTTAHRENSSWNVDFCAGLTPTQALDAILGSEKRSPERSEPRRR
jgi:hypothetical protein